MRLFELNNVLLLIFKYLEVIIIIFCYSNVSSCSNTLVIQKVYKNENVIVISVELLLFLYIHICIYKNNN